MSLEDPDNAQRRPPSVPLPSPESDPGHPWASLADGGRLGPWLEGGGGKDRAFLDQSVVVSLEIPFPNVSRPA